MENNNLQEQFDIVSAENETMKLTIRNLEWELQSKCQNLDTTEEMLNTMVVRLSETRDLLHASLKKQSSYKNIADGCVASLRDYLWNWLTKNNREVVKRALKYYEPEGQMRLMIAVFNYLIFDKKFKALDAMEQRHFDVIVERIDQDAITIPVHSMIMGLLKKYGPVKELRQILLEAIATTYSED
jgi:hypothetical protein